MYVNPFVAGILTTITVEIVLAFAVALRAAWRNCKK